MPYPALMSHSSWLDMSHHIISQHTRRYHVASYKLTSIHGVADQDLLCVILHAILCVYRAISYHATSCSSSMVTGRSEYAKKRSAMLNPYYCSFLYGSPEYSSCWCLDLKTMEGCRASCVLLENHYAGVMSCCTGCLGHVHEKRARQPALCVARGVQRFHEWLAVNPSYEGDNEHNALLC